MSFLSVVSQRDLADYWCRSSRPPPLHPESFRDQETMSSGDESDNDELTDYNSDSDYSDVPDGA